MEIEKVVFYEYPNLKKEFACLVAPLVSCKFRPEKMDFSQRMRSLSRLETAYRGLYSFVDRLLEESYKVPRKGNYNADAERYLRANIPKYNIIKVSAGENGEYIISAPPLGDRPGGNAAFISYFTDVALEYAKRRGEVFKDFDDGCIIVKHYCHCKDVAMGTLENREVHSLTDTIVQRAGMDDAPFYFDCCYVWCESDSPRTEIVITSRQRVSDYDTFVNHLYESSPEKAKRQYRLNQTSRDKLFRAVANINEQLNLFDCIEVHNGIITKDFCLYLIHMAKDLSRVIEALRRPFINDSSHTNSMAYSRTSTRRKQATKKTPEDDLVAEQDYLSRVNNMVSVRGDIITIKTSSPFNFRLEDGRSLCDEQEIMLRKGMNSPEGKLILKKADDLVVEVIRFLGDSGRERVDADNINTHFLAPCLHRVKILYSRANENSPSKKYDCIIKIYPKNYKITLA